MRAGTLSILLTAAFCSVPLLLVIWQGFNICLSTGGQKYLICWSWGKRRGSRPTPQSLVIGDSPESERSPGDRCSFLDQVSGLLSHCSGLHSDTHSRHSSLPSPSSRSEKASRELVGTRCCLYGWENTMWEAPYCLSQSKHKHLILSKANSMDLMPCHLKGGGDHSGS